MNPYGKGALGFEGLKFPTGYGSVSLKATINGIDVGDAWSKKTTYSIGTEHAEDALVDYVELCEWSAEASINMTKDATGAYIAAWMKEYKKIGKANTIEIVNLTATPCSKTFGTCDKPDMTGCTERLAGLLKRGWKISLHALHYYQPQGVPDAKNKSKQAIEALVKLGMTVKVDKD